MRDVHFVTAAELEIIGTKTGSAASIGLQMSIEIKKTGDSSILLELSRIPRLFFNLESDHFASEVSGLLRTTIISAG